MKNIILISLFFLISAAAISFPQEIEKEILEYSDSDLLIITKSRKLISDKLEERDTSKIKEVLAYLDKKFDPDKVVALWDSERWLLDYWTGDFDDLISRILLYQEEYVDENKLYPSRDLLWNKLLKLSSENKPLLFSKIDNSRKGNEGKYFLKLFLNRLLIDNEDAAEMQIKVNKEADEFLSYYSNSDFMPFVRNYIRYVYLPSDWGFGLDLFLGYGQFNGTLDEYFEPNVPFGVTIDVQYKSLISYWRLYMGLTQVRKEFTYNGTWKKDLPISVMIPEISFGLPVFESSFIKAVPFMGLTWTDIAPPEEDAKLPGNDVDLGFSTGFTYGLNFDFKFSRSTGGLASEYETGFWLIRLRLGYTHPSFSQKYSSFTGNMFYLNLGIGIFGRGLMRDL